MNVLTPKRNEIKGFTIVELLITIAVISILMTVSVFMYRNVQAGADDKEREADVATIMDALEKYYAKHGEYPADEDLNPAKSPTRLPNFDAVKSTLTGISSDALEGPGGYEFYAACDGVCTNTSDAWRDYMTKSYYYWSRKKSDSSPGKTYVKSVAASYGDNKGWGCTVTTTYDDPGFVIAWYSEAKKVWVFKKSAHGSVSIASYSGGPVAPQTCAFS